MVASKEQIATAIARLKSKLGTLYQLGAKWKIEDTNPSGPVDCSGISKWGLGQAGVLIPDGSFNQIKICKEINLDSEQPLDLGFYHPPDTETVDHVVICLDEQNVIEARGNPYRAVITRPKSAWLAQKGFLGWYTVPGIYIDSSEVNK